MNMACNELTAIYTRARGLALPLEPQAIHRARQAGVQVMRMNNPSQNAPMLAVNRRLGLQAKPGRSELHLTLRGAAIRRFAARG